MIGLDDDRSHVVGIIRELKEKNPDAILWCDWAACRLVDAVAEFYALPIFKEENYLPKALLMINCFNQFVDVTPEDRLLLDYVLAPDFVNQHLMGFRFTEDATPYSSKFGPKSRYFLQVLIN